MEPEKDAYGQAIRDYHENEEGFELVERDDGRIAPSGGPETYFRSVEDWAERERLAMEAVDGTVLDVGCGAGRHALYLQEAGHAVVGIDVSPIAIEVCRDRGLSDARVIGIEGVDSMDSEFDTILLLGNNLGLLGTRETAPARLEDLAEVAAPGAKLLAESRDPYQTDDADHLRYHERNRERGRLGGALRMRIRYKRYATDWFDYLLASQDELHEIVEPSPWHVESLLEPDPDTPEYVGVLGLEEDSAG